MFATFLQRMCTFKKCSILFPRLLKIRNPWGSESWNGDWSDNSSKWQKVKPDVKKELKPDGNTHGIFWIEFREFRKYCFFFYILCFFQNNFS